MGARPSEIRAYLLRFAKKKGIAVREYLSDGDGPVQFFCHLEMPAGKPLVSSTAVSRECHDNALVMAFLHLGNPELDFLPDKL